MPWRAQPGLAVRRRMRPQFEAPTRRAGASRSAGRRGALEGFLTAKALAMGLRAAGRDLSRAALVKALKGSTFDLGGVKVQYSPTEHVGSRFAELLIVDRNGRFIH